MIYFLGDVHGQFDHILPALKARTAIDGEQAVIFLGDIESPQSFENVIAPLEASGIACWYIHGNHDTDTQQSWRNLETSTHRSLDGRVVTIQGQRIAGLGGVFRGLIWRPPEKQKYSNMDAFKASRFFKPTPYIEGKLLTHSSSIWPDTYDQLALECADILVTHEAPSCHPHGFTALDDLALSMGVTSVFHGHHHELLDYSEAADRMGFRSFSVPYRGIMTMHGELIWRPSTQVKAQEIY